MERLRQELERVAKHPVAAPFDLEVPLHILADRRDRSTRVGGHLLDNQVLIVATQVVENHRLVVDDFALTVAEVVRSTDVVAGHVVVVVHLAPVGVLSIEWTVGAAADAADGRLQVAVTLHLRQVSHRPVRLQVLNALGLPLDKLVEKLLERVLPGEKAKLPIHLSHLRREDDRGRSTTLVLLIEVGLSVENIDLREH